MKLDFSSILNNSAGGGADARLSPELRFTSVFLLSCALMYIPLHMAPAAWFQPVNELNAAAVGALLRAGGSAPLVKGTYVSLDGFAIQVIGECSALFSLPLIVAFILATPAGWRQRLAGLLLGGSALLALNVIRIYAVFLAGIHSREAFEYLHAYLGQVGIVFAVALVSLLWLGSLRSDSPGKGWLLGLVLRFLGFSGAFFLIWIWVSRPYVQAQYLMLDWLLGLFGFGAAAPEELRIFPHTFASLNLVLYSSLLLASEGMTPKSLRSLALGLGLLVLVHFLFVAAQVAFFQYRIEPVRHGINVFLALQEWIVPFVLWYWQRERRLSTLQQGQL